jgi:SAM-dependent methyltransferase
MTPRTIAGDVDYGVHGKGYARQRRTDPRIAHCVHAALGCARTVLNVGAGAGSYEPADRSVVAVEPSAAMRAQRAPDAAPVVDAIAEALPFGDDAFDASMATVTVHQWKDLRKGLAEMRRVTRGPVVILTFDGELLDRFWLARYAPEMRAAERSRMPRLAAIDAALGGDSTIVEVPVPIDCVDGFIESFYARPEALLDPAVRRSQSSWAFVSDAVVERFARDLTRELDDGTWDRLYGNLRTQPTFDGSLRLIVNRKGSVAP